MIHLSKWKLRIAAAGAVLALPHAAMAQGLQDLNDSSLRSELQTRYDAGLAATLDPDEVAALRQDLGYRPRSETRFSHQPGWRAG